MHDLKYNDVRRSYVSTCLYVVVRRTVFPIPPLSPSSIHPSILSIPSIHTSIHPSIRPSVSFHPPRARWYNHPRDASMGLGVQQEPSPPQPSWHGPGRPNERGREPFLPAPRAPTPPALPRQPRLGVGLRLLRGSIHGNPPYLPLFLPRPFLLASPRCRAVSLLDATTRPPPRGMDKTRDT